MMLEDFLSLTTSIQVSDERDDYCHDHFSLIDSCDVILYTLLFVYPTFTPTFSQHIFRHNSRFPDDSQGIRFSGRVSKYETGCRCTCDHHVVIRPESVAVICTWFLEYSESFIERIPDKKTQKQVSACD